MQLPVLFGKYELQEFLGGGMSQVYKARDTVLGRTVAVKILTAEGIADADTRARFLQEAKVSAALVHDHVIRIFDYGEEQGWPFIVMEFLVGSDLKHAIRNKTTGDLANRLRILIEGAKALDYVHKNKLIHRDIKPDNMHIDESGRVRLMDFGIAKTEDMSLTKTGFQVGTPFYMAPEQVNGDKATERTDVYAYGMVMYEMFAEERAITGDTITAIFAAILNQPVNLEKLRAKETPEAVIGLIERMTAKDPMARPATFADVSRELETVAGVGSGTVAMPQTAAEAAPAGVSGKKVIIGLLAVAVLAAAGVIYMLNRSRDTIEGKKADGTPPAPVRQTETGEMRLVAGGNFLFGNDKLQGGLPAYYMDTTEVTNLAYKKFCEAKGRALPKGLAEAPVDHPVVNVTLLDAKDFCAWAGKRLPLPLEWEKAARGADGRLYPWGDQADASKANVADNTALGGKSLVAVDALPGGASPSGMVNMAGNAWEWVDEAKQPSPQALESFAKILNPPPTATEPWYMAKGGSFDRPLAFSVAYEFITLPARYAEGNIGFRCAGSVEK